MANNQFVFVDADYFVAIYNINDKDFPRAKQIADKISKKKKIILVTSNYVLLEAYTILSQRASKAAAIKLGEDVRKNSRVLHVIHVDSSLNEKSWEIFKEITAKNMSFVDTSTIALMRAENISTLLSFDEKDFNKSLQRKYNFKLLS